MSVFAILHVIYQLEIKYNLENMQLYKNKKYGLNKNLFCIIIRFFHDKLIFFFLSISYVLVNILFCILCSMQFIYFTNNV